MTMPVISCRQAPSNWRGWTVGFFMLAIQMPTIMAAPTMCRKTRMLETMFMASA